MRQSTGCSTPASAAKQWFEELAQKKKQGLLNQTLVLSSLL